MAISFLRQVRREVQCLSLTDREAMMDSLYRYDNIVITGFIFFLWVILAVVLIQVVSLFWGNIVRAIAISSALTVGVFRTASLSLFWST